jgi:hypothetical protein
VVLDHVGSSPAWKRQGPGSVVIGTGPLSDSLDCARAGRIDRETTAKRMSDRRCMAERGDDFMRGGEMQGMFQFRSELVISCGVASQVEFAETLAHDQIAHHV